MSVPFKLRRDTAANWTSNNPTLALGEVGYETDTGLMKIGDAATAWTSLLYVQVNPRKTTAALWTSANPTLRNGEVGYETDTGLSKTGDGSTAWTSLLYSGTNRYRLAADRAAIGPTIADYFASAAITLGAARFYELEWELFFTKTTAGTLTFTIVNANAPANIVASYIGGPVTGVGTVGAPVTAAIDNTSSTGAALPATTSLTTAVEHHFNIKALIDTHATLTSACKLQVTSGAGTITPRRGSNVSVRALPQTNIGAFA